MNRVLVLLACACVVPFIAVGCSSSSSSGDGTTDAGNDSSSTTTDSGSGEAAADDPLNCVPPGTKGNELGMGGYCTPGGHQCDTAGPNGDARLCSADYAAPPHAWFCTYVCSVDADCGSNEFCVDNVAGKGCVPNACAYLEGGDSGTGDTDASSDGASD
jgi:hypothetical protein